MNTDTHTYFNEVLGEIASILEEVRSQPISRNTSPFLTIKESAEYLNVSKDLIKKWVFQKRITSCRIGKCVRIKKTELEKCINQF